MSTSPRRLGKYELRERLGRGGMGEVWRAFDTQLQRNVAIKLLHADLQSDPSFVSRFQREAQVIASLHHPNIVKIYDFQVSQQTDSENSGRGLQPVRRPGRHDRAESAGRGGSASRAHRQERQGNSISHQHQRSGPLAFPRHRPDPEGPRGTACGEDCSRQ